VFPLLSSYLILQASALPIIIGVVCGFVVLNAVLLITWLLVKQRRLQARNQNFTTEPKRHSKLRHSSTMTLPIQAPSPKLMVEAQNARKSTIGTASSSPWSRDTLSKPERPASLITSVLQTQRISISLDIDHGEKHCPSAFPPTSKSNVNMPRVNALKTAEPSIPVPSNKGSLGRAFSIRSADSASLYSVASAAPEIHDRVFRPWALETIPASPVSPSRPELRPSNEIALIPEELAPETYDKWRADGLVTNHGKHASLNRPASLPSSPNFPVTAVTSTPSAALPGRHSFSQTSLAMPPPPPPARSPLRDVRSQWIES